MRYEPTDHEWTAIRPMLPNKPRGVPRVNGPSYPQRHLLGIAVWSASAGSAGHLITYRIFRTFGIDGFF